MKLNFIFTSISRVAAFALVVSIATTSIANDAMKINSTLPNASAQSMKQHSTPRVNDATMTAPKSPALPTQ
ncbi:MAG: hypothetical protein ACRDAM_09660, partial [Casimicrobium sp.]